MEFCVVLQELPRCMFRSSLPQFVFNRRSPLATTVSYLVRGVPVLRYTIGADGDGMDVEVLEE